MFMLGLMVMGMVASTASPVDIPVAMGADSVVYAAEMTTQGKCGDNVTYKYDSETQTLTISGTGAMWDDYGFARNLPAVDKVIIESGVDTIGSYSFDGLDTVNEVEIANTVTTIKEYAFPTINEKVEIPASVTKVEERAFDGAEEFVFKGDIKGYETNALGYYRYIGNIVLYGTAEDLGKAAYSSDVNNVTIAQENTKCKVGNGCLLSADGKQLYYCINARSEMKIPSGVENISTAAFCGKNFKKLVLNKELKNIGDFAFENVGIKNVEVNSKINSIGVKAFYGSKIKEVSFSGKTKLGVSSFGNKVKIKYSKKFKQSQTTISTATIGKKFNIRFAKVSGASGYQIRIKKGKKTYKYTTTTNSYKKTAPKKLREDYSVEKEYSLNGDEYLNNPEDAAYVAVRPYKIVKGKKRYGRWSAKAVLSYNK